MTLHTFGEDPLVALADAQHPQAQYLRCYLSDLKARWVLEEARYFDRDYLEEHAAYYGSLASQHPNICRRLHFFDEQLRSTDVEDALSGSKTAEERLQQSYLGFAVLRPLAHSPLGRTVVRWYPDEPNRYAGNPRIVTPARTYVAHYAGIPLRVTGLAWQQQDGAVALCATIALWSMLHSSAFDDHHAIPTTTDVTRFAYRTLREGAHVFPALDGLENRQIVEAIARAHLTPILIEGDAIDGFSRDGFSTTLAALLRSGYPVLLSGSLDEERGGHVVCVTGFRETGDGAPLQDAGLKVLYVHDDNLGPNVREEIELDDSDFVRLRPRAPAHRYDGNRLPDPAESYPSFTPKQIIVAVHEGLHMPPGHLTRAGEQLVNSRKGLVEDSEGLRATVQFARISNYVGDILARAVGSNPPALAAVRRRIVDGFPPIGLHLGVIRIGARNRLVADVLVDAGDPARFELVESSAWWRSYGTVVYSKAYLDALKELGDVLPLGELVTDPAV